MKSEKLAGTCRLYFAHAGHATTFCLRHEASDSWRKRSKQQAGSLSRLCAAVWTQERAPLTVLNMRARVHTR
jgi:hypothetical protein